jgi:glycosyltransferase involved in cell wall biosynthesis
LAPGKAAALVAVELMRVGLDLLFLVPGESGGRESYARELIPAMLEHAPELELVAFVNRDAVRSLDEELGGRGHTVAIPVSARSRAQWAFGEQALVSAAAMRERVQLLHSMANFAPAWGKFRRVVTIHDLQYLANPDLLSRFARGATHALISLAARRADRIIAVSHAGRDEIRRGLNVDAVRIDVVANGVRPAPPHVPTDGLRELYGLGGRPVVLTVATRLAHKNLPVLIETLARIEPEDRPMLVIAGHGTDDGVLEGAAVAAGIGDSVRLLGRRTVEELNGLYALAACLVLPTLHEGFGLPVLEAMARALPVACSDIPALREVAGDAALYFNPRDPSQIAARISELTSDEPLASRLRELGRARAGMFSWQASAAGTLASYRKALER